jgi:hypothetical protein
MRKGRDELYLHEQMLLLVLRDEAGTVESKAGMYRIALCQRAAPRPCAEAAAAAAGRV